MGNTNADAKALHVRAAGLSDVGCVRERNEDAFLSDDENRLFIVADGVGGHARGDIAARMVVELLPQIIKRRIGELPTPQTSDDPAIRKMLAESVSELSQRIHAGSKDRVEYRDMGSTAVVALVTSHHAHIAHMGDSRAYLFREGEIRKLTEDHSLVGLLMHHGEITPQEAEDHPAKGRLTRFVGMEAEVDPDVQTTELQPGDRLLLCTDGLWGMVLQDRLAAILAERNDPEITSRDLIAAGKTAGGQDNLTAVTIDA